MTPTASVEASEKAGHVGWNGIDAMDRLRCVGFAVAMEDATGLDDLAVAMHGLKRDEHIPICRKPSTPEALDSPEHRIEISRTNSK